METENGSPDLMEELAAILDGRCVWCRLGMGHPGYSQCDGAVGMASNSDRGRKMNIEHSPFRDNGVN